jgi:hypothetical protein
MNIITVEQQLVCDEVVSNLQTIPPEQLDRASAIAEAAVEAGDA